MRFPSLKLLYDEARRTLVRFPFVLLAALVAVVAGIVTIDDTAQQDAFVNALLTGQLGIPLLFALAVYSEKRAWPTTRTVILQLTGIAALAGYYVALPDWLTPTAGARFAQLNVALHLLVAFFPYVRSGELNGFWQYNKSLFLRFLTAALYSAVLYAGLAIALIAIDQLLGVNVEDETYFKLFVVVGFLFNTWFFLGGVPRDWPVLESSSDYPRGLKVFTQYILVPIVLIYLVILTIYLVKVIVTREWPSGMIGYLVSAVSAAGIFSLLLVHPIRDQEENRWIRTLSKWFYVWLLPAIVMLFLAIGKRIAQYGITENRYFLLVLTVWLVVIATYFTVSRRKNIKFIPTSLCLIAFVTSFGPWGAYQVSRNSQAGRLSGLLATHGILVDERIEPSSGSVPFEDRREISAVLSYLIKNHGTRSIEPWFEGTLANIDTTSAGTGPSRRGNANLRAKLILDYMNVAYVSHWQRQSDHFNYTSKAHGHTYNISGYDVLYRINRRWSLSDSVEVAGELITFRFEKDNSRLDIVHDGETLIDIRVSPLLDSLRAYTEEHSLQNQLPPDVMRVFAENEKIKVIVYFTQINGTSTDDGMNINHVSGDVMLTIK